MGRAKQEVLFHEFPSQRYVSRPEYRTTWITSVCIVTRREITRISIIPSSMDGNDHTTALEGHQTTGLAGEIPNTIPDHATSTEIRRTTKVFGHSNSPLEPREEVSSVQAS